MKKIVTLLGMVCMMAASAAGLAADCGKQRVVYHVNYGDEKRQSAAMRNIQNHINAVGKENLDLRVVMHSAGYKLLANANNDPNLQQKITNLKDQGVKFQICANTLRGKKLNYKNDLYDVDQADIVPSGVAELAKLQGEGFAYIRP
jgi:intracellular sulfur oxidation DsrE/DsrF family protein